MAFTVIPMRINTAALLC